jgi:hypothetical protein
MIVFRQADPRYPFLWSDGSQPPARWHGEGEGPAHYFADTPDGAWAELLRHEEIVDPADASTLQRTLWAVEIGDDTARPVSLPEALVTGGADTYRACQDYARRARARGARRLVAPSAALLPGGAAGRKVAAGVERQAQPRTGRVIVSFEPSGAFAGWKAVERGGPPLDLLERVRHLAPAVARASRPARQR